MIYFYEREWRGMRGSGLGMYNRWPVSFIFERPTYFHITKKIRKYLSDLHYIHPLVCNNNLAPSTGVIMKCLQAAAGAYPSLRVTILDISHSIEVISTILGMNHSCRNTQVWVGGEEYLITYDFTTMLYTSTTLFRSQLLPLSKDHRMDARTRSQ